MLEFKEGLELNKKLNAEKVAELSETTALQFTENFELKLVNAQKDAEISNLESQISQHWDQIHDLTRSKKK